MPEGREGRGNRAPQEAGPDLGKKCSQKGLSVADLNADDNDIYAASSQLDPMALKTKLRPARVSLVVDTSVEVNARLATADGLFVLVILY